MKKKPMKTTEHPILQGDLNAMGLFTADPFGSYTGRPLEEGEQPVQDADDL